ncbi:MAG: hypothetical protein Q9160_005692 [Pyrenula sp. 1 TL-2023]
MTSPQPNTQSRLLAVNRQLAGELYAAESLDKSTAQGSLFSSNFDENVSSEYQSQQENLVSLRKDDGSGEALNDDVSKRYQGVRLVEEILEMGRELDQNKLEDAKSIWAEFVRQIIRKVPSFTYLLQDAGIKTEAPPKEWLTQARSKILELRKGVSKAQQQSRTDTIEALETQSRKLFSLIYPSKADTIGPAPKLDSAFSSIASMEINPLSNEPFNDWLQRIVYVPSDVDESTISVRELAHIFFNRAHRTTEKLVLKDLWRLERALSNDPEEVKVVFGFIGAAIDRYTQVLQIADRSPDVPEALMILRAAELFSRHVPSERGTAMRSFLVRVNALMEEAAEEDILVFVLRRILRTLLSFAYLPQKLTARAHQKDGLHVLQVQNFSLIGERKKLYVLSTDEGVHPNVHICSGVASSCTRVDSSLSNWWSTESRLLRMVSIVRPLTSETRKFAFRGKEYSEMPLSVSFNEKIQTFWRQSLTVYESEATEHFDP